MLNVLLQQLYPTHQIMQVFYLEFQILKIPDFRGISGGDFRGHAPNYLSGAAIYKSKIPFPFLYPHTKNFGGG